MCLRCISDAKLALFVLVCKCLPESVRDAAAAGVTPAEKILQINFDLMVKAKKNVYFCIWN